MTNHIDKMADALVDALKYSNSDVDWVELDGLRKAGRHDLRELRAAG